MGDAQQATTTKTSSAPVAAAPSWSLQARPFAAQYDDESESEADLMAGGIQSRLMDMPVYPAEGNGDGDTLQREPEEEDDNGTLQRFTEEEEEKDPTVQPKLTIGQPGDKYEQEADAMAAQVMRMPADAAAEKPEETEDALQEKPQIQAKGKSPKVPENFVNKMAQQKGGGQPLSDKTRSFMEPRFGADFSGVRVHEAPDLAGSIQAQAFTHGQDIYFNSGKYNPSASSGKTLLAHELTHTIQQTGGSLRAKSIETVSPSSVNIQRLCSKCNKEHGLQAKIDPQLLEQFPEPELDTTNQSGGITPFPALGGSATSVPFHNSLREPITKPFKQTVGLAKDLVKTVSTSLPFELSEENNLSENIEEDKLDKETDNKKDGSLESLDKKGNLEKDAQDTAESLKAEISGKESFEEDNLLQPALDEENAAKSSKDATAKQIQATMAAKLQAAPQAAQGQSKDVTPENSTVGASTSAMASSQGSAQSGHSNGSADASDFSADEEAESEIMRQQLEAVALDERTQTGDSLLSPSEKTVAKNALTNAPAPPSSGGGGGGGGGAAISENPPPPVPDVSQSEPTAAIASISHLPPAQLQSALGGVSTSVTNAMGTEREALAANPPQAETLDGREGAASAKLLSPGTTTKPVKKQPEGTEVPTPKPVPSPLPSPAPSPPVATPSVQNTESGTLSESGAQQIKSSIRKLPTRDAGVPNTSVGKTPKLTLDGNANPDKTQAQKADLDASIAETQTQGRQDAAEPMGEQEIYATVPKETLLAEVSLGTDTGSGAGSAGAMPDGATAVAGIAAVSVVAQEEQGAEIQAAISQAQGDLSTKKGEHEASIAEEHQKSNSEIDRLKQENIQQQETERTLAQEEVGQLRDEWQAEQETEVASATADAKQEVSQGLTEVETEKTSAEKSAEEEIYKGQDEAEQERIKGDQAAAAERQKGEKASGGILGWAADKAKGLFESVKNGIKAAFDKARKAIRAVIEKAKELATAAIELGRKAIVGIIRRVGDALIAIGDVLLAQFPELRDKYRGFIQNAVKVAEDTVNYLAENLKTGIQAALDLLGKGLDAALSLCEQGMLAAVDELSGFVSGVIAAAKSAIEAFGAFAAIAPDIAANPGQWVSNLGGAVGGGVEGPTLWEAFQTKTEEWFGGKVQQVTSLTPEQVDDLDEGGFGISDIAKMVWDNIVQAIPGILIGILLKKLVSMIVPAVGAVLTILQSLQAAWGTVSQILAAFSLFVGFLQAVKSGSAAPLFAGLLAAAGIVVLNFIAQWLLSKLVNAAKAIAGRLKGMASGLKEKREKRDSNEIDETPVNEVDNRQKNGDTDKTPTDKSEDRQKVITPASK